MSTKVLTLTCVKCGTETLWATRYNISLQIERKKLSGLSIEYRRLDCYLCSKCEGLFGKIQIILREPDKKDIGIFQKGPTKGIELFA